MTKQTNMNRLAYEIARNKFKDMLKNGAFPKVEYKFGDGFESYSMIEHSTVWATFSKVVQNALVAKGYEYGLWENARNAKYLAVVTEVVSSVTEEQVNNSGERFQTMWG